MRSKTIYSAKINRASKKKVTKDEIKQIFQQLFEEHKNTRKMESPFGKNLGSRVPQKLQSKMDYFYTAYNTEKHIQPYMVFEDKLNESIDSKKDKLFYKTAQTKWGDISKNLFNKNSEHFRQFLNAVNTNMYSDLIKMGTKYCSKLIKPKSVNGRRTSVISNATTSEKNLTTGLQMLKNIVREKILSKKRNLTVEPDHKVEADADTKHEILTSLVYISRANNKSSNHSSKKEIETFRNSDGKA